MSDPEENDSEGSVGSLNEFIDNEAEQAPEDYSSSGSDDDEPVFADHIDSSDSHSALEVSDPEEYTPKKRTRE